MNVLGVVIGLARERVKEVRRALSLAAASAAQAPPPRGRSPRRLHPVPLTDHEGRKEQAVENGYNVAWMRRKARDEAEELDRFGEEALRLARVGREEAQHSVEDADDRVRAMLRRMSAKSPE
jgi:hypothetical protein